VPFFEGSPINGDFALEVGTLEPVGGEDAAAMLAGAAETALGALREDDPAVAFDSEGLAGSCHVGEDSAAEDVVLSVFAVHPFSVLAGLVELLSIHVELLLAADDRLDEGNVVRVVEDGGRFGGGEGDEKQKQTNIGHHEG
jgi:hypothetical protein